MKAEAPPSTLAWLVAAIRLLDDTLATRCKEDCRL